MKKLLILTFFILSFSAQAARVDTVMIMSEKMNREIGALILTPDGYDKAKDNFPVLYLLHGYSGNYKDWDSKSPHLPALVDKYQVIVVCPDGGYNSWYIDSPVDPASQFESYVTKNVVDWVDAHYNTIKDRSGRAITGLSMGGHGGLFLGIRHQDIFGAAGSMSGGVDLTFRMDSWDIAQKLGSYQDTPLRWDSLSVVNMVDQIPADSLPLIIDCGVDDFFIDINRDLHQKLLQNHIPHDYTERPGEHNWDYWDNSIQYQMLFFSNFFKKNQHTEEPPN